MSKELETLNKLIKLTNDSLPIYFDVDNPDFKFTDKAEKILKRGIKRKDKLEKLFKPKKVVYDKYLVPICPHCGSYGITCKDKYGDDEELYRHCPYCGGGIDWC